MQEDYFTSYLEPINNPGRVLASRRERLGSDQSSVGTKLGVTAATISNIEWNKSSSHRQAYINLLDRLERERLEELIGERFGHAVSYIAELVRRHQGQVEAALAESPPDPGSPPDPVPLRVV